MIILRVSMDILIDSNLLIAENKPGFCLSVESDTFRHRSLKERAAEYGGQLNLSDEVDWGDPAGSEPW